MTNKVLIISHALNYLGQSSINDLDNSGNVVKAMSTIYDQLILNLIGMRPWSFALMTQQLVQNAPVPLDTDWHYSYQIPSQCITPVKITPYSNFVIRGKDIYSNEQSLVLTFTTLVDPSFWTPQFVTFVEYSLTCACAMLVTQNASIAEVWEKKSQIAYENAALNDSRSQPQQEQADQPFIQPFFIGYA